MGKFKPPNNIVSALRYKDGNLTLTIRGEDKTYYGVPETVVMGMLRCQSPSELMQYYSNNIRRKWDVKKKEKGCL